MDFASQIIELAKQTEHKKRTQAEVFAEEFLEEHFFKIVQKIKEDVKQYGLPASVYYKEFSDLHYEHIWAVVEKLQGRLYPLKIQTTKSIFRDSYAGHESPYSISLRIEL